MLSLARAVQLIGHDVLVKVPDVGWHRGLLADVNHDDTVPTSRAQVEVPGIKHAVLTELDFGLGGGLSRGAARSFVTLSETCD